MFRLRIIRARAVILVLQVVLHGCSPGYQAFNKKSFSGYIDEKISEDGYKVSYYFPLGKGSESLATSFIERRASELCGHGFELSEINEEHVA